MRFILTLAFLASSYPALALEPKEIRICLEDKQVYPLYNSPGQEDSKYPGILVDFVKHVSQKHGVKLNLLRRPPAACRVLMKTGAVDAYGIVSYMAEREEWAVYPKRPDGSVDHNRIYTQSSYTLYSRPDKLLPWDGKDLASLKGIRIGSSDGYSINDELKKAGAIVETFKSVDAMHKRLMDKQVDGLALLNNRLDKKARDSVHKYEVPLKRNDYYFTFSSAFYKDHKEICEKIWKDSVLFEESTEGKKLMAHYETISSFP